MFYLMEYNAGRSKSVAGSSGMVIFIDIKQLEILGLIEILQK